MKTRWLHNLLHKADFVDDGALLFLTFIDVVLTVVFFIACSIDLLTMIALIFLGLLIPLVKVRAWIKLKFAPALIWAIVTGFAGWSFMLSTISEQDSTPTVPTYVAESKKTLNDLQAQQTTFRNNNQRTNANAMQESIDKALANYNTALDKASKEVSHVKALSVFGRIPTIIAHPSAAIFIATVFYLIIFGGFEWTIFSIATDMGRNKPVQEKPPTEPRKTKSKRKRTRKPVNKLEVAFVDNEQEIFENDEPIDQDGQKPLDPFPAYQFKHDL